MPGAVVLVQDSRRAPAIGGLHSAGRCGAWWAMQCLVATGTSSGSWGRCGGHRHEHDTQVFGTLGHRPATSSA
jgi:hypothetical protein